MDRLGNRIAVRVLLVLAGLFTILAMIAVWTERQVLDTDQWVETSSELLADPEINSAVQEFLVDTLFNNVDVQAELSSALPPRAQPLSGPLTGALRSFADEVAGRALESTQLQNAWAQANRTAHTLLLNLIEGNGQLVDSQGGAVTLNLEQLLDQLATRLGISQSVVDKLPDNLAQLEIVQSDELDTVQKVAKLIHGLAIVFSILALGLLGLAIYLARGRRPAAIFWAGLTLIGAALVVFAFRRVAGDAIVNSLTDAEGAKAAAASAWTIATSLLASIAKTVTVYGLLFVIAGWLGSSTFGAPAARRFLAPILQTRIGWVYTALGLAGLTYFALAPTHGLRSFLTLLLLVLLAGLGIAALRRMTEEEYPDADFDQMMSGLRERASGISAGFSARRAERRAAAAALESAAAAAPADPRLDALERLGDLRDRGLLTDDEFKAEKARALAGSGSV